MHVVIHVNGYYDWEPVPDGVTVTEADISSLRVKPAHNGGYLMRVSKKADTHTEITLDEGHVISRIWLIRHEQGLVLNRAQGLSTFVSVHHMPHHAHRSWVKSVEIEHDTGPNEALFRSKLEALAAEFGYDFDEMMAAYMTPTTTAQHVTHMSKHFGIKESV